jgi:hypothetical protein
MWVLDRVLERVVKSGGSGDGCTGADIEAFCAGEPETVPALNIVRMRGDGIATSTDEGGFDQCCKDCGAGMCIPGSTAHAIEKCTK